MFNVQYAFLFTFFPLIEAALCILDLNLLLCKCSFIVFNGNLIVISLMMRKKRRRQFYPLAIGVVHPLNKYNKFQLAIAALQCEEIFKIM